MICVFFNPLANNKKGAVAEEKLKEIYKNQEISFFDVTALKNVCDSVKSLQPEDVIVLAGGDGSLSRFVNDIYELHIKQKFLYFPCGSGNDFKNDVYESAQIENGMIVMNQYIENLPKVYINDFEKYFINDIGYGIDGYCCEEGDKVRASSDKKVNYSIIALKGLLGGYKPRNAVVTVDGVTKELKKVWLAPAMIGRFYGGGMMIAPEQDRLNTEKTLSCVVASKGSNLKILSVFPSIFKGKHMKHTEILDFYKGHDITVEFDKPCALQIDGEMILNVKKYRAVYGK